MNLKKMNKGLDFLREKYGAKAGEITIKDGHCYVGATPLLPCRDAWSARSSNSRR